MYRFAELNQNAFVIGAQIDAQLVQNIVLEHGMNHHPIVFTDEFAKPIAYYDGKDVIIYNNDAIRKVVIYPSTQAVSTQGILKTLTTAYFGNNPIYGYVNSDQKLLLGYESIQDLNNLQACDELSSIEQAQIATLVKISVDEDFCGVLYDALYNSGRIINQV